MVRRRKVRRVRRHKMPARSKVTGRFLKRGSARRSTRRASPRRRVIRRRVVRRTTRRYGMPARSARTGRFLRGSRKNPACRNRRLSGKYGPKPGKKRGGRVSLKRGPFKGSWGITGCGKKGYWTVRKTSKGGARRVRSMPKRVVSGKMYRWNKRSR